MTNDRYPTDARESAPWRVAGALRHRWWVVLLATVLAVGVAALALSKRTDSFESTAQILVTPYTQSDPALAGIRIVRQSNDAARDLQTATTLLTSSRAAAVVARAPGLGLSAGAVEDAVSLEPLGGGNVIAVTGRSEIPATAARLANLYAQAAIAQRNIEVSNQARAAIRGIDNLDDNSLDAVRQQLRVLRDQGDVTLQVSQPAVVPTAPSGPSDRTVLLAALLAGLALGVAAAVLIERGDRRVPDRAALLDGIPVPVLVGVPAQRGHSGIDQPPAVREAFRTLQLQLDLQPRDGCRTLLVTSASSGDGKTTSVLNLAFALVSAGHRVIVVDFDVRKPDVAEALGLRDPTSVTSSLAGPQSLSTVMQSAPRLPPLRVVQVTSGPGDVALLPMLTRRMQELLTEADGLADYVVIDTAPIGEVGDALPLMGHVDDVLIVGRPGSTDGRALETMAGLFERAGVVPTGWIVTGADIAASSYLDDTAGASSSSRRRRRSST
jgi:capsular exopolysaccharide synthesis family protein